jgi:quaternary ammonium compound-resistance protein SugE
MTAWLALAASSALQVGWLVSLREIQGFRRPIPILLYAVFGLASTLLLARALEKIPLSTAYAVWTGLSVAGSILFDVWALKQPPGVERLVCLLLILLGTTGLRLSSLTPHAR